MNKNTFFTYCPDENELALFIEGKLSGDRLKFVKQHLESCSLCNEAVRLAMELEAMDKEDDREKTVTAKSDKPENENGVGGLSATLMAGIVDIGSGGIHNVPMVAENNSDAHERFIEHHDSNMENNNSTNMDTTIHEAQNQFGEEAKPDVSSQVYQGYSDTCAIRSQQLILNDFGIPVSQEDLINEATQNGWYAEGEGTPMNEVGNLLENHGIPVNRVENANVYNLLSELSQGHKVIIGVDADELWHDGFLQDAKDAVIGETPNHALIVAGIDTSNPDDIQVILKDPGTGDVAKAYSIDQFMDAWHDSGNYMVSTDTPAPLAYNPEMINFDYSLGHIESIGHLPYDYFEQNILPYSQFVINDEMKESFFQRFKEQVDNGLYHSTSFPDHTIDENSLDNQTNEDDPFSILDTDEDTNFWDDDTIIEEHHYDLPLHNADDPDHHDLPDDLDVDI